MRYLVQRQALPDMETDHVVAGLRPGELVRFPIPAPHLARRDPFLSLGVDMRLPATRVVDRRRDPLTVNHHLDRTTSAAARALESCKIRGATARALQA